MYRCTECHSIYEKHPEYCDCGNDEFVKIEDDIDEEENEYEEQPVRPVKRKRKLTPEEQEELDEENEEKRKSSIALIVTLILCIVVFIIPPHKKHNPQDSQEKVVKENLKLPSVSSYWNEALPSNLDKDDPLAGLPLLNSRFASLSRELNEYLVSIGRTFNGQWDTSYIKGAGSCTVQFVINTEGTLNTKNIIKSSGNRDLNDSISLLLTNTSGFSAPPEGYKGEKIYITFSIDKDGVSKVFYPAK